jgi:hypothetical protein
VQKHNIINITIVYVYVSWDVFITVTVISKTLILLIIHLTINVFKNNQNVIGNELMDVTIFMDIKIFCICTLFIC